MRGFFGSTAALLSMLGLSSAAWAQQQTGPSYGPHMWDGGGWMFFGPLMMIVFIAAIVVVVVLMVRWLGGTGHHPQPAGEAGADGTVSMDCRVHLRPAAWLRLRWGVIRNRPTAAGDPHRAAVGQHRRRGRPTPLHRFRVRRYRPCTAGHAAHQRTATDMGLGLASVCHRQPSGLLSHSTHRHFLSISLIDGEEKATGGVCHGE